MGAYSSYSVIIWGEISVTFKPECKFTADFFLRVNKKVGISCGGVLKWVNIGGRGKKWAKSGTEIWGGGTEIWGVGTGFRGVGTGFRGVGTEPTVRTKRYLLVWVLTLYTWS